MTLHLVGIGLDKGGVSEEAKRVLSSAEHVYLENYTVDFPYDLDELGVELGCDVQELSREDVENEHLLRKAKKKDVVLLVYGDPLSATTHTQLILACKNQGVEYRLYHNASILSAVAECGLQLYKFGKTVSMPRWQKNYEPTSFLDYLMENKRINAHTLVLTDIGMRLDEAILELEKACNVLGIEIEKEIVVLSRAGTKDSKVYYEDMRQLKDKDINLPFCIVIPAQMHFLEEEALEELREK